MKFVKAVRQIRFVDKHTFHFGSKGTISQNSLLLHDVDADGNTEFIVGDLSGTLQIFKFLNSKPSYKCENLGSICCIGAGNVTPNKSIFCVVTAEGECHFFDLSNTTSNLLASGLKETSPSSNFVSASNSPLSSHANLHDFNNPNNMSTVLSDVEEEELDYQMEDEDFLETTSVVSMSAVPSNSDLLSIHSSANFELDHSASHSSFSKFKSSSRYRIHKCKSIVPYCTHRVPCNITTISFVDLNGDGYKKIVFGCADRNVYVYEYTMETNSLVESSAKPKLNFLYKWPVSKQVNSISVFKDDNGKENLLVGLVSGGYTYIITSESATHPTFHRSVNMEEMSENNIPTVSTPTVLGGTNYYSNIQTQTLKNDKFVHIITLKKSQSFENFLSMDMESNETSFIGMPIFTTSNLKYNGQPTNLAAFVGLDGKVIIQIPLSENYYSSSSTMNTPTTTATSSNIYQNNNQSKNMENVFQIDLQQEVLGVTHCSFTGTGLEELCIATWDGVTYVCDERKNIAFFNLKERICGFCAGNYSIAQDKQVLCLFYVTFSDQIVMYYDCKLESIPAFTMLNSLHQYVDLNERKFTEHCHSFPFSETVESVHKALNIPNTLLYPQSYSANVTNVVQPTDAQMIANNAITHTINQVHDFVKVNFLQSLLYQCSEEELDAYLENLRWQYSHHQ